MSAADAASTRKRIQDLPPKEGYAPFQTERVKLRTVLNGKQSISHAILYVDLKIQRVVHPCYLMFLYNLTAKKTFGFLICSTLAGLYAYYLNFKMIRRQQIEMRSARFAIMPLLLAERDRV